MKSLFAAVALVGTLFFAGSAHALTIDPSTLDTMRDSKGPFGLLDWKGVSLKLTGGSNGTTTAAIETKPDACLEPGTSVALEGPQKIALSRIVKGKDGDAIYEHVDLSITPENPALQVTSRSTVRLREVARVDAHAERAKTIPVYAYRSDAKHVVVLVESDGMAIGKRDAADPGTCAQNGGKCVIDTPEFQYGKVGIVLGADRRLGQARGDVKFADAPKGETNPPRTYIINASYTQTARDPEPVIAITMHTIDTVFQGDGDDE
jgi:hypothetical protein